MVRQFVRVSVAVLLGLGLLAGSLAAQTVTSSSTHAVGPLLQTDSVVTVGPSAIDKFGMHRLRRAQGAVKGALLLLPPLGNGFSFYTADDSGGSTSSSSEQQSWSATAASPSSGQQAVTSSQGS